MNDETRLYRILNELRYLVTPPHTCSYLDNRFATTLFVDPHAQVDNATFSTLAQLGFRRSGEHLYRPHCAGCRECIAVRIPVGDFRPSRSQRRNLKKNQDLRIEWVAAGFEPAHFELYRRYMRARHPGSSMDSPDPTNYQCMLRSAWSESRIMEMYQDDELVGAAITDQMSDGLSAVYTFFDPKLNDRGLGVFSILKQVEAARHVGRSYVYLGYWIRDCDKMAYKQRYRPLEYFNGQSWRRLHSE